MSSVDAEKAIDVQIVTSFVELGTGDVVGAVRSQVFLPDVNQFSINVSSNLKIDLQLNMPFIVYAWSRQTCTGSARLLA